MEINEVKQRLIKAADEIIANKDYLTDLDRSIGDADHGNNMAKGFNFTKEALEDDFDDYKTLFNKVATILLSKVGGASGPLYGSFFMKFAASLKDIDDFNRDQLNKAFKAGVDGVKQRGKAEVGDKTMVDVLEPVSNALNEDKSFDEIIQIAEESMNKTKDIKANKGRASYVGERSIGHIDPGAASSYIIIKEALGGIDD
ncbi:MULTISPECIES: dihydroxyacetone kinase subunit DhaL [Anaerococcus]|jgi:dihydroxyacetone kinase, L subunit|uniref:phosphoenolpyruvate--glycerone phosphotransferase n=1 Tax=Anaerococcus nagyae TaxID=1755241 RepID=A0A3E2TKK9_9FIRM|nr:MULTISPECIES: dihydroxyacetone kinase subunit DhaL [Anaerococcus]MBP2068955.1 dihydroxyacetone kinase-like protein [Anaerococcus nagyae]MDU1829074.1 dihydroxyacetone kinase subunit DhaL [Anaerococcus sp.]MDU1865232.1 dihydroxyacetone kinase subunit DhaL [Anaerococcus sp.]MDU2353408.1 dihydroxyacetone kinase subunit DhaL [Anaerococcus sp.]MDU2566090.1 dihydroxyacetone kinase subunit DhaL [Anaerococcus sp.]